MSAPVIFGCEGTHLSDKESGFFREVSPWGFILFRRNIQSADQVRGLCASLRDAVGWNAPILVDHEGGRVSRLSPELAPKRPPGEVFGLIAAQKGLDHACKIARIGGQLLARDASALGINVNCVPMVDVRQPDAHDIVGDRAFGESPEVVATLGRALAEGSVRGGCLPIIKHIPGHGRAAADSHLSLPTVETPAAELERIDFHPFKALSDLPLAMTAHIVYTAYDADQPATLSKTVIDKVIRGTIGFDGLLMTDDLSMKALSGSFAERTRDSLKAGCDLILHCNGDMAEMQEIAGAISCLSSDGQRRSDAALAQLAPPASDDQALLEEQFALETNAVNLSA